ncbi:MAG: hypothetical protein ACPGRZ_01325 [Alphaproteobacteria bacterium]
MKIGKVSSIIASGILAVAMVAVEATAAQSSSAVQTASNHLSKEDVIDRVFTNVERRILQRYYEARYSDRAPHDGGGKRGTKHKGKSKQKGMPPGIAKRGGDLPPGLAKRGDTLPPGLAKRLPRELEKDLPPRSPKYRRVVVDNDIVLIDAVTNKVLDILEDVVRGKS